MQYFEVLNVRNINIVTNGSLFLMFWEVLKRTLLINCITGVGDLKIEIIKLLFLFYVEMFYTYDHVAVRDGLMMSPILGRGGHIWVSVHYIQGHVPVCNILAMYGQNRVFCPAFIYKEPRGMPAGFFIRNL